MTKRLPVFGSDEEAEKFLEGDLTEYIGADTLAPFPFKMTAPRGGSPMVIVARIGAAHGLKGEVRVKALTGDPLAATRYGALTDSAGRSFTVEAARPAAGTSPDMLVVRFAGVGDRNAAEALNGTELFIPRARLPAAADDEYYHADLIGLAAVTVAGEALGTVTGVENFGAGDLLQIAPPRGATLLVPFTRAVVPEVDLAARRIVVDPPPGLLDEPKAERR